MERLFKSGIVTTIAGVLILGFALWQYAEGKDTKDVAMIAGYAFVFLRSKDSLIGLAPKKETEEVK